MKYTIEGFDQVKLIALGLNGIDAYILRWFVDFRATGRMRPTTIEDDVFYWVKYQTIIDDLPALEITNCQVIGRRMLKLVKADVLKKHITKHGGGTFTSFGVGDELAGLLAHPPDSKGDHRTQKVPTTGLDHPSPPDSIIDPKDSSIRDSSTRDKKKVFFRPIAERILKHLNEQAGHRYKPTDNNLALIMDRLKEGYGEEDCRHVIDAMVKKAEEETFWRDKITTTTPFRPKNFPRYLDWWKPPPSRAPPRTPEEEAELERARRTEKILYGRSRL